MAVRWRGGWTGRVSGRWRGARARSTDAAPTDSTPAAGSTPDADTPPAADTAPADRRRDEHRRYTDHLRATASAVRRRVHDGELGPAPPLLALAVTWIVFQSLNDNFLSPRNLSVLSVDIVGTGMVAIGVVFVLLIGELDLSVGSLAGLSGAMFAALNVNLGMAEWLAVIIAVMGGAVAGGFQGFVFTKIRVPAFVVTLAGLLAWNGLMLYLLGPESSIGFSEDGLVSMLTSRYFDAVVFTYGLAALGTGAYFLVSYGDRRRRGAAGMPCRPVGEILARTALLAVVAFAAVYVLGRFEGLPLALLIFIGAIVASDLFLRRTPYGRQVLALGGGVEAARRSGVHVAHVRIWVFLVSGTLAAVGGLFVASRLSSATTVPGSGSLLINAIAAAVIGGTSLFGGRGSTWSALLGVLIIQSIASGMALLGVEPAVQFMITGGVLLTAVVFDSLARRAAASRGRA